MEQEHRWPCPLKRVRKEARMARKRFTAEQVIMKLREAEVGLTLGVDFKGSRVELRGWYHS